jgi:hypothetical protein
MADKKHLAQLKLGVISWNEWVRTIRATRRGVGGVRHEGARIGVSSFWADLSEADLSQHDLYQGRPGAGFSGIDLIGANLRDSNLQGTNLAWANLTGATLSGADLEEATLASANLSGSNLSKANLKRTNIAGAKLLMANMRGADLTNSNLYETQFVDTDLTEAVGLESCRFSGPSTLDHRTILNYARLPEGFLCGCGLPDSLIKKIPELRGDTDYHSCFISYSSADRLFVKKLYTDLQASGVRCWFAPEDLKIGDKIWDAIDGAVESYDKLLLVLSESSIRSEWVEDEVNKAFSVERKSGTVVLFPIRIDNSVMVRKEPWAVKLKDSRNIGNFTNYEDEYTYRDMFIHLLRDLRRVTPRS